ncbi:epidermal growth factor receptor substrate 15-like 1 isoform X3 [Electrophorus electricus]|uniref:epidermal growth factor receptor substrate 15-like 1 isoform X3 n=1 Tax=Electrophorus electricus TaxID=8005 RepID=UPI0015D0C221|nr:epidermal growth factor receptor substrate 15-like 1 isoform X3 [Electrophorus electricus]
MAALMSLTQISSANPAYENFYRQVDPGNTGKVGAAEAAQFLKKSGLSDSTLSKIWDLSDPERKGYLDKRGFFIALRLVASAQSGNDVSPNNITQSMSVPAPKFRDTASPSLVAAAPSDPSWALKVDDKAKYDGIFESLSPVNGLLSGDKVKPVLINSNLPLDVLGKIWDLSDIDKDGHLDKEEFAVAMHLVYRAREKEPVPAGLPSSFIPPSKRKKSGGTLPGSVSVLPSSPFLLKENLRSTAPLRSSPLTVASGISPSNSFRSTTPSPTASPALQPVSANWVVPQEDRAQYEDIFELADSDFDGMVGGGEVKDIFMNSGLPQNVLAHIWSLADTKSVGKLTKEQFCLAMHLMQQKVKGVDPPQSLTAEMIPPSERHSTANAAISSEFPSSLGFELPGLTSVPRETSSSVSPVEMTGIKELDDVNKEISQLQSEKRILEQEIRQKEEAIRQKNSEVQSMHVELERENSGAQEAEQQKQVAQDRLQEMEQQKSKLEDLVKDSKNKCQEENSRISSLQTQILSHEADQQTQEKEVSRVRTDLYCLEQEEQRLEDSVRASESKLESILKLLRTSQDEMDETHAELSQIQEVQKELNRAIERIDKALGSSGTLSLAEIDQLLAEEDSSPSATAESSFRSRRAMFSANTSSQDPFQTEDPFKSDPFNKADPFGGDPFKQADPFHDSFTSSDPFAKSAASSLKQASPFGSVSSTTPSRFIDSDPFATTDPFASESFGGKGGFADFGSMSKGSRGHPVARKPTYPLPPSKKPGPARPAPPPYGAYLSAGRLGAHQQCCPLISSRTVGRETSDAEARVQPELIPRPQAAAKRTVRLVFMACARTRRPVEPPLRPPPRFRTLEALEVKWSSWSGPSVRARGRRRSVCVGSASRSSRTSSWLLLSAGSTCLEREADPHSSSTRQCQTAIEILLTHASAKNNLRMWGPLKDSFLSVPLSFEPHFFFFFF